MAVADAVVEYLRPVQERYAELAADPGEVDRLLAVGADTAATIADPVLAACGEARPGCSPRAFVADAAVSGYFGSFHGAGFARSPGSPARR